MLYVTATDFRRHIGHYLSIAKKGEIIYITKYKEVVSAIYSYEYYKKCSKLPKSL